MSRVLASTSTPAPSSPHSSLPSPPSSPSSSFSSLPSSVFSLSVPSSPPPSPPPTAQVYGSHNPSSDERERSHRNQSDTISHALILPSLSLGRASDSERDLSGTSAEGTAVNDLLIVGRRSSVDGLVNGLVGGRRTHRLLYIDAGQENGKGRQHNLRMIAEGKEGAVRIFADAEIEWNNEDDESQAIFISQIIVKALKSRPIFTALILAVSSPPTPLETAIHTLVITHVPVLPVFFSPLAVHGSPPSTRRDTITASPAIDRLPSPAHVAGAFQPLTPRQLRHTLFRRQGALAKMKVEAIERRNVSATTGAVVTDYHHDFRDSLRLPSYQAQILDPLHLSSLMVLSFSLLRESTKKIFVSLNGATVELHLNQVEPGWWFVTAAAFVAGVGVGWMLASA